MRMSFSTRLPVPPSLPEGEADFCAVHVRGKKQAISFLRADSKRSALVRATRAHCAHTAPEVIDRPLIGPERGPRERERERENRTPTLKLER